MKRKQVSRDKLALAIRLLRDVYECVGDMRCTVEKENDLYCVYGKIKTVLNTLEKEN